MGQPHLFAPAGLVLPAGEHITPPSQELRKFLSFRQLRSSSPLSAWPAPDRFTFTSSLSYDDPLWTPPFRPGASPLHHRPDSTGHWRFKLLLDLDLPNSSSAWPRKTCFLLRAIETPPLRPGPFGPLASRASLSWVRRKALIAETPDLPPALRLPA